MKVTKNINEAKKQGFVVIKNQKDIIVGTDKTLATIHNAYWNFCGELNQVFAQIIPRGKHASVILDLFPTKYDLTEAGQAKVVTLFKSSLGKPRGDFFLFANRTTMHCDFIPIADAPRLVNEVLAIIAEHNEPFL